MSDFKFIEAELSLRDKVGFLAAIFTWFVFGVLVGTLITISLMATS